jgi:hypothetical protein
VYAHRFAFYPSAPRVSGATGFLPASALSCSPTGLATPRWRRRSMRPTDVCHPYESCAPAPRAFPARSRGFHHVDVLRSLRLRRVDRGSGCFTTSATASADRRRSRHSRSFMSHERGRCLPTVVDAIEPLTPLSRFPVHPHASGAFAPAATWPGVLLLRGFARVGEWEYRLDHR